MMTPITCDQVDWRWLVLSDAKDAVTEIIE
jgi:hypothetical protein